MSDENLAAEEVPGLPADATHGVGNSGPVSSSDSDRGGLGASCAAEEKKQRATARAMLEDMAWLATHPDRAADLDAYWRATAPMRVHGRVFRFPGTRGKKHASLRMQLWRVAHPDKVLDAEARRIALTNKALAALARGIVRSNKSLAAAARRKEKRVNHFKARAREEGWPSLKKAGFTRSMYDAMLLEQEGRCWTCGEYDNPHGLVPDHNHKTGKPRRLVCLHCNLTLGLALENLTRLRGLVQYLEEELQSALT